MRDTETREAVKVKIRCGGREVRQSQVRDEMSEVEDDSSIYTCFISKRGKKGGGTRGESA